MGQSKILVNGVVETHLRYGLWLTGCKSIHGTNDLLWLCTVAPLSDKLPFSLYRMIQPVVSYFANRTIFSDSMVVSMLELSSESVSENSNDALMLRDQVVKKEQRLPSVGLQE
jgi:hypothetical protein